MYSLVCSSLNGICLWAIASLFLFFSCSHPITQLVGDKLHISDKLEMNTCNGWRWLHMVVINMAQHRSSIQKKLYNSCERVQKQMTAGNLQHS